MMTTALMQIADRARDAEAHLQREAMMTASSAKKMKVKEA
jgi:hypothetical protein